MKGGYGARTVAQELRNKGGHIRAYSQVPTFGRKAERGLLLTSWLYELKEVMMHHAQQGR